MCVVKVLGEMICFDVAKLRVRVTTMMENCEHNYPTKIIFKNYHPLTNLEKKVQSTSKEELADFCASFEFSF